MTEKNARVKRKHSRHTAGIPIEVSLNEVVANKREYLINISRGGLCFHSSVFLEPGTRMHIKVPLLRPVFKTWGHVAWCKKDVDIYAVGVRFDDHEDQLKLKVRMVEQICDIEKYKKVISRKEHRALPSEEAAMEWIRKYAASFTDEE